MYSYLRDIKTYVYETLTTIPLLLHTASADSGYNHSSLRRGYTLQKFGKTDRAYA